jgi:hypothetical protein
MRCTSQNRVFSKGKTLSTRSYGPGLWIQRGQMRIYKKQGEYSKALIDGRLAGRVPLIRSSEMSRQIKGVMVPTKQEMLRMRE